MGIYDRDYYRGQRGSYLDAFGLHGSACKWLIALNIVAFVLEFVGRGPRHESLFFDLFQLDPTEVVHGQVWRLLSYAFLHDPTTWTHIVFNMLFLWWFGNDIEQIYGTREFVLFYLVAALLGGVFYTGWEVLMTARPNACVGASGAVMAVMVLYACHYPARIIYLFFILPVPIWLFVVFYVAMDSFVFLSQVKTQTAVVVHLAGAAFAFVYYKSQFRVTSLWPDLKAWRSQRARPRLRVLQPDEGDEPVAVAAPPGQPLDEQLEAKVDAVLEKVARHGQASLTASEREILLRASEIYKRRRT